MSTTVCHNCSTEFDPEVAAAERAPVEIDERGLPWACSMRRGLGLPVIKYAAIFVFLNGVKVKRCIAYCRRTGRIWQYAANPDGTPKRDGDDWAIEQLTGVVTVEPMESAA